MSTFNRILRLLTLFVVAALATNCGDKGTNPHHGITGTWPVEATGRYQLVTEYRFCPYLPFGCDYDTVSIDTMDICGDPTPFFISWYTWWLADVGATPNITVDGEISDSLYHLLISTSTSYGYLDEVDITSASTGLPPAREKWQVTGVRDCLSCEEYYKNTDRFTFIRIGDGDCTDADSNRVVPLE